MKRHIPPKTPVAILGNERGIALVMALVLGLIGMLMITAIIYMVGTGTWIGGSKKRYQTALNASHGGMNFFAREIIQRVVGGATLSSLGTFGGILTPVASDANFTTKLTTTGRIGDAGYPVDNPDATLTFIFTAPTPTMTVNTAIVGASRGNSGTSSNVLVGGGVVNTGSGTVTPQHIPYLYQTDIQSQSGVFARERARLSSIYAY
ncbi:MAG: hypothetical protein AB1413_10175 [Thermodesulfobacteriota bacterium]